LFEDSKVVDSEIKNVVIDNAYIDNLVIYENMNIIFEKWHI